MFDPFSYEYRSVTKQAKTSIVIDDGKITGAIVQLEAAHEKEKDLMNEILELQWR